MSANVLTIVGALLTIIVGSYRTKRAFVSDDTRIRIGRYEHPRRTIRVANDGLCVAISAPGAAPCAFLCSGDKQQSRGDGRDDGRCALRSHGGVGGAVRIFLPILFLQLQLRHCPFALRPGDGGEARNHVHFALDPPKTTKIALFLKKHHEKFGGVQKSHYLCNRLRQVRAFSSAGLEHLPYKQRVGGSNPSTPTGVFSR